MDLFFGVLFSGRGWFCGAKSFEPGPIPYLLFRGMRRLSEDSGGLSVRDWWGGGALMSVRSLLELDVHSMTFVELTFPITLRLMSSVSNGPLFLLFCCRSFIGLVSGILLVVGGWLPLCYETKLFFLIMRGRLLPIYGGMYCDVLRSTSWLSRGCVKREFFWGRAFPFTEFFLYLNEGPSWTRSREVD